MSVIYKRHSQRWVLRIFPLGSREMTFLRLLSADSCDETPSSTCVTTVMQAAAALQEHSTRPTRLIPTLTGMRYLRMVKTFL
jgi:hypothetical protein